MDVILFAVAIALIVFVPFDWYVAWKFVRAAWIKPRIPSLTLGALRSTAVAVAATLAGLLGLAFLYFQTSGGARLWDPAVSGTLIASALIVISLPNIYALRWLASDVEDEA